MPRKQKTKDFFINSGSSCYTEPFISLLCGVALIFSKEGAVFRASFCRALFFAEVKIAIPTHQKFASAIFLFSAKSKGSTAPFAAHALLAFLGVISLEITLRSAGISAEIFLIRQKKLSARSAQSNGEVLFWKSRKKKRRIGFGKLSRKV